MTICFWFLKCCSIFSIFHFPCSFFQKGIYIIFLHFCISIIHSDLWTFICLKVSNLNYCGDWSWEIDLTFKFKLIPKLEEYIIFQIILELDPVPADLELVANDSICITYGAAHGDGHTETIQLCMMCVVRVYISYRCKKNCIVVKDGKELFEALKIWKIIRQP